MCLIYAATVKKMVYTCLLEDTIMYNKSYIYIYIKKHSCILYLNDGESLICVHP